MNKEQVYDTLLHPLMDQILSICREHKIAMIASFAIPTQADPDLHCTSLLSTSTGRPCVLRGAAQSVAMTVTGAKPN